MTIDEFADVTRRVIAHEGFDGFQSTAVFPARNHLALLSDVPSSVDVEAASLEWAFRLARENEEFLVAFKADQGHFAIVKRVGDVVDKQIFTV